jgi:CRP-like cAMP-binding protein
LIRIGAACLFISSRLSDRFLRGCSINRLRLLHALQNPPRLFLQRPVSSFPFAGVRGRKGYPPRKSLENRYALFRFKQATKYRCVVCGVDETHLAVLADADARLRSVDPAASNALPSGEFRRQFQSALLPSHLATGADQKVCSGTNFWPAAEERPKGHTVTTELRLSPQSLACADLFLGLPTPVLEVVSATARLRRVPRGTRIFNQGDEGVRAHVVIEGGVRISQTGSDGAQVVLRFIGPGSIFGTVALFTDGRYPADATTVASTLEASWSESELMDLMTRHPQIAINAIRIIGLRLQEVQDRVRELATQRADRRIAHALVRLARQSGQTTSAGTTISFPLRRKDVADVAGTTLHTASRILSGWAKAGLLISQRRRLTIRNTSLLLRIADEITD